MFHTIDSLTPGQTLLVRVDLNSPVQDGTIQDNRRFKRHVETLRELLDTPHAVVVLAHQGRPGRDTFLSLEQHAAILEEYLDESVSFCSETVGATVATAIDDLDPGEMLVVENVRMHQDELADRTPTEHAHSELITELAPLTDAYVGDAYSVAHRGHASIVGFPQVMTACAGRVMAAEYQANSAIQSRTFDGPVRMVLGGTKADDLLRVVRGVEDRVDDFLLGGVIGELCLRARGQSVGYDVDDAGLFDPIWAEHESTIKSIVDTYGERIHLPVDLAYADEDGERAETAVEGVEKTQSFLDIGANTIARYRELLGDADAVFVKGAVGVFEDDRFHQGTTSLLKTIGERASFSVIGGGDTSRAIDMYGLDPATYDHISIAGGAYVRALAGEPLPGVVALEAAAERDE